ncbi:BTAD domain-containing putative transcriptional regulator [Kitasatospora sp. NPDC088351]|uniref:AfsR/SARP family transcriptional regulator n=1 Tax=Kitasatospora sp. NPDC088351 TaxID=3155180 RepID=UPI00343C4FD1
MEFHLLGSVELSVNGRVLPPGPGKQRLLLAALALDVGKPLSHESLAYRLWGEDPPPSAVGSLYSHVSRLRGNLLRATEGKGLDHPGEAAEIDTQSHTYVLRVDPQLIDWHRYTDLSRRARTLADNGEDTQARTVLSRAEELWRGEPLAGLPGSWAQATRTTMTDQRLATTLLRVEVELRLGRFSDLVPELTALREQRPTDERLAGHLMTALYGSGRQAEALGVYPAVVRLLRAELGTAPGEWLTRLHDRMLQNQPVSELPISSGRRTGRHGMPKRSTEPVGTSNLPARTRLVGRAKEIRRLLPNQFSAATSGGVVTVESIAGMAGVGKTALALSVAHLLQADFPDGQYYVRLRAHAELQHPLSLATISTTVLRLLGVKASELPSTPDKLAGLCRTLLSERRAVLVLDDAVDPGQVRPILPAAPTSLIIVTSRRSLTELPGTRSLFLDTLPVGDAIDLFGQLVGEERAHERAKIAEVVRQCGLLPLAIELAASRLRARPSWSLDTLIQRLSKKNGRLSEIRDGFVTIASVFQLSYQSLSTEQQQAFRRLGLHPGPDFGLHSAAALIGQPLDLTDQILESLLQLNLIQERSPERYQFHDLLHEYAVALAHQEESAEARDAALRRLVGLALHATDRADHAAYPNRPRLNLPTIYQFFYLEDLLDDLELSETTVARRWLEAEHASLTALEESLRGGGLTEAGAWLSHLLAGHLDAQGHWADARQAHLAGVLHWRATANNRHEAWALIDLGAPLIHMSRYLEAWQTLDHALTLARTEGDAEAVAEALDKHAKLHWAQSDLASALAVQQEALEVRRATGDHWNIARFLCNVGVIHFCMGNHQAALDALTEALPHAQSFSDSSLEFKILNNIGELHLGMRDRKAARHAFERIIRIGDDSVSQLDLATVKVNLAATIDTPDEFESASDLYRSALATFRELGSIRHEADTCNGIGDLLNTLGSHHEAASHHERALALARSVGAAREEAAALRGIGRSEYSLDSFEQAIGHLKEAAALAYQIQAPHEEVRARELLTDAYLRAGSLDAAHTTARRALELLRSLEVTDSISIDHLTRVVHLPRN